MLTRQFFFDRFLTGEHVFLAPFLSKPLLDLVLRAARFNDGKPVERRASAILVDENFAYITICKRRIERYDPPVYARTDAMIADVGVDCVREIERRTTGRHRKYVAAR